MVFEEWNFIICEGEMPVGLFSPHLITIENGQVTKFSREVPSENLKIGTQ